MVTIKDLARIAKVSPTTVSNVLHDKRDKVSPEVFDHVKKVIDDTGYVSNMAGRLLSRNGSKIIGVIMTYARRMESTATEYPFYSEIIGALESAIRKRGYYMMLYTSATIDESIKLARAWDIEGLVVIGNTPEESVKFKKASNVPIVFIDTYANDINNVGIDDRSAMHSLVDYLIALGHQKIAFISDSEVLVGVDKMRYDGFCDAFHDHQLPLSEESLIHIDFRREIRHAFFKELVASHYHQFSALCFTSDYYAADAVGYLSSLGQKIPEDISITGFDNNLLAQFAVPKITTINQSVEDKGTAAIKLLFKIIKNKSLPSQQIQLQTSLIIGASTKFLL